MVRGRADTPQKLSVRLHDTEANGASFRGPLVTTSRESSARAQVAGAVVEKAAADQSAYPTLGHAVAGVEAQDVFEDDTGVAENSATPRWRK